MKKVLTTLFLLFSLAIAALAADQFPVDGLRSNGDVDIIDSHDLNVTGDALIDGYASATTYYGDGSNLANTHPTFKNVFYVAADGNDVTGTGSIEAPFLTIAQAVASVPSGESTNIIVGIGTFSITDLVLPPNVSICGQDIALTILNGNLTTGTSGGISLHSFQFAAGHTLTVQGSAAIRDVYSYGNVIVSGSATIQGFNFHITPALGIPLVMSSSGKFQTILSTIASTGDNLAIQQSAGGGTVILSTSSIAASRAAGPTILSTSGNFQINFSQVLNTGGGIAANIQNGASVSNPNALLGTVFYGTATPVTAGTAVTLLEACNGAVSGSAIVTHNHDLQYLKLTGGTLTNDLIVNADMITSNDITAATGTVTAANILLTGNATAAYFFGDGSNLSNIVGTDNTKVLKSGDTMTGALNISAAVNASSVVILDSGYNFFQADPVATAAVILGSAAADTNLEIYGDILMHSSIYGADNIHAGSYYGDGSNLTGVTIPGLFASGTNNDFWIVDMDDTSGLAGGIVYGGYSAGRNLYFVPNYADLAAPASVVGVSMLSQHLFRDFFTDGPTAKANVQFSYDSAIEANNMYAVSLWNVGLATETTVLALQNDGDAAIMGTVLANAATISTTATASAFYTSGNATAGFFFGDGSNLTNVSGTDNTRVLKAGDTMTGNLTVEANIITDGDITAATGTVTAQVLSVTSTATVAQLVMTGPVYMSSNQITSSAVPSLATHLVNKAYVDGVRDLHESCRAATFSPLTAVTYSPAGNGSLTKNVPYVVLPAIDGVTLSVNDRIVLQNQTTTAQNGIYVVTSAGVADPGGSPYVLTRADDWKHGDIFTQGEGAVIEEGTRYGDSFLAANATGIIGTHDPLFFVVAVSKYYVDQQDALKLNITGGTLTGRLSIVSSTTPNVFTLRDIGTLYSGVNEGYFVKNGSYIDDPNAGVRSSFGIGNTIFLANADLTTAVTSSGNPSYGGLSATQPLFKSGAGSGNFVISAWVKQGGNYPPKIGNIEDFAGTKYYQGLLSNRLYYVDSAGVYKYKALPGDFAYRYAPASGESNYGDIWYFLLVFHEVTTDAVYWSFNGSAFTTQGVGAATASDLGAATNAGVALLTVDGATTGSANSAYQNIAMFATATQATVDALYNNGRGASYTTIASMSPDVWYKATYEDGNAITDYSGNGYHLAKVGSVSYTSATITNAGFTQQVNLIKQIRDTSLNYRSVIKVGSELEDTRVVGKKVSFYDSYAAETAAITSAGMTVTGDVSSAGEIQAATNFSIGANAGITYCTQNAETDSGATMSIKFIGGIAVATSTALCPF